MQDPLGHISSATIDGTGKLTSRVTPLGFATSVVYDTAGRIWANVEPLGARVTMAYDLAGRPTTLMDARGSITATRCTTRWTGSSP